MWLQVLPIVMGARPEDYEAVAPRGSFLHVDSFSGPAALAAHLRTLDAEPALYNAHFRWAGRGRLADARWVCRVCAVLHHPAPAPPFHSDIPSWWAGPGTCTNTSWSGSWSLPSPSTQL